MAETNSPPVVDDDKPVTEDDLRALKYPEEEVETAKAEDETSEGEETEGPEEAAEDSEQIAEDGEEETPTFVKQFENIKGNTPEEYAKNLEIAYQNSTAEAIRLNGELKANQPAPPVTPPAEPEETPAPKTAADLFVEQQLQEQIQSAYADVQKNYPQVSDPTEYTKFTQKVATFSRVILDSEQRLAKPAELYDMAITSLGWTRQDAPDDKDKLGMALKDGADTKTASAPSKPKAKGPQVTEEMLKLNRKMYPGKTDQEIIEELQPYL